MSSFPIADHEPLVLEARNPLARAGPIPDIRIEDMLRDVEAIVRRNPNPTSNPVFSAPSASTSCGPNDTTGVCERYTSSTDTTTLPVVLGVALPLTVALVLFVILHRRHVKKLRQEDADDKTKSLDFGLQTSVLGDKKHRNAKSRRDVPEMTFEDAAGVIRHGRGMSIDLDLTNPYILPPGLQQSRESLHSLSRSLNNEDDKYRPATSFYPNDGTGSYPSSLRSPADDSSSFTGSSRRPFETDSNRVLLKNAQRISRSGPPTRPGSVRSAAGPISDGDKARKPLAAMTNNSLAPMAVESRPDSYMSTGVNAAIRASNNYLGAYIRGGELDAASTEDKAQKQPAMTVAELPADSPSSIQSVAPPETVNKEDAANSHGTNAQSTAAHPPPSMPGGYLGVNSEESRTSMIDPSSQRQPRLPQLSFMESKDFQHDFQLPQIDVSTPRQSQQAAQPLAIPTPAPQSSEESSASPAIAATSVQHHDYAEDEDDYYIEDYADDLGYDPRRLTMGMRPLPPDDPTENPEQRAIRIRSFYKEYFDESKTPNANPRQNVEYFDGSEDYAVDYYDEPHYGQMPPPPRGPRGYAGSERHRATFSAGSFQSGPRAYSSASGQYGAQGRRAPPKKNLPPPKPLHVLPTPHKLKDDLFLPVDFAPPASYRERRAGTPDSLRGGLRPYSPGLKGANPLVSSFDDLAVMPSPHALRKSSTFTGLDFALPPRIGKADGTGSDSGSIRSNRSAMSAVQLQSIRAGAYRVSRIPKEVAGTKDEMANALRPQWDMRNM